ncbi:DUF4158 domain-containing protein [Deinococcus sp. UYEF24]
MTTTVPPLLTAAQRNQFTRFPLLDEPTLSRNYLLSTDDLVLIRQGRHEFNKLGYAVQLTVLQHLGRSIRPDEQPPGEVLQYLADQLHINPDGCVALIGLG